MLARWIDQITRPEQRIAIDFKVASLPIHHGLDADQAEVLNALQIPLPSSRTPLPDGPFRDVAADVLAPFNLAWEDLRVRHLKDVFFSKGSRAALFFADKLRHRFEDDDLHPGRKLMALDFELPKGAYATLVVKRVTDAAV
jgi:tRNA pseudouridine13 synthase